MTDINEIEKLKEKVTKLENENYMQRQTIRRLELESERLQGSMSAYKLSLERCMDLLSNEIRLAAMDIKRRT